MDACTDEWMDGMEWIDSGMDGCLERIKEHEFDFRGFDFGGFLFLFRRNLKQLAKLANKFKKR